MERFEIGAKQISFTIQGEGNTSILVIQGRPDEKRQERLPQDPFETRVIDTEMISPIVQRFMDTRNWDELVTGGDLNDMAKHVRGLSDEDFKRFTDSVNKVLEELPVEGRRIGSKPVFLGDVSRRINQFAMDVRTTPAKPPLRKAS